MAKTESDKSNLVKAFAVGAALSALAGYVAGILTAPKSGRETRADIRDRAQASYATAEKELKKLHTELTDVLNEVGDRIESFKNRRDVDEALKKGRHAKQKAREVLSTLHEGEAEDTDLRKAIKDATDAIEHLRNFLKK
ncbi:MAG TPA: YtxH domain-containing protein [Candidatus Saccharimonadales bacterium]|jgi:gas vesicle protein